MGDKVGDIKNIISEEDFAQLVKQKEEEAEAIKAEIEKFREEMKHCEDVVKERKAKERKAMLKQREEEQKRKEEEKEKQIAEKMKQHKEQEEKYKRKMETEKKQYEESLRKRRDEMLKEEQELEELLALALADDNDNQNIVEKENNEVNKQIDDVIANKSTNDLPKGNTKQGNKESEHMQETTTSLIQDRNDDDSNSVWAALRQIKESSHVNKDLKFHDGKNKCDEGDFDSFIKEIQAKRPQAKREAQKNKIESEDIVKEPKKQKLQEIKEDESVKVDEKMVKEGSPEKASEAKTESRSNEPFDYEAWAREMDKYFKKENEAEKRAKADDESYLQSLKQVINERIEKDIKNVQINSVNDGPLFKPKPKPKPKPKNEMNDLKQKEKERKRSKERKNKRGKKKRRRNK